MDSENDSHDSPLLLLPPELRNKIYREVLVKDDFITASTQLQQPSLLRTNHQIRTGTLQIYYAEIHFRWHVHDLNAGTYIQWASSSKHRRTTSISFELHGDRNWKNLLHGLEASYTRRACGLVMPKPPLPPISMAELAPVARVAYKFFETTWKMRKKGLSWKRVKRRLKYLYEILVAADMEWEQETVLD